MGIKVYITSILSTDKAVLLSHMYVTFWYFFPHFLSNSSISISANKWALSSSLVESMWLWPHNSALLVVIIFLLSDRNTTHVVPIPWLNPPSVPTIQLVPSFHSVFNFFLLGIWMQSADCLYSGFKSNSFFCLFFIMYLWSLSISFYPMTVGTHLIGTPADN